MRKEILKALRAHAEGHIQKHKMNVEIYLENPAGIGEHPGILEAIESELLEISKYDEILTAIDNHFG